MAIKVKVSRTVKVGGVLRVPSKAEGENAGEFEWNPEWGDVHAYRKRGLLKILSGASSAGGEETAPAPARFSSPSAEDRAKAAGLTLEDFQGRTPTGRSGFTVADVEAFVSQLEAIEQRRVAAGREEDGGEGGGEGGNGGADGPGQGPGEVTRGELGV